MRKFILLMLCLATCLYGAKLPDISSQDAVDITRTLLDAHVTHKKVTVEIMKRTLNSFFKELDPSRLYLTENDIWKWTHLTDHEMKMLISEVEEGDFSHFVEMAKVVSAAIHRKKGYDLEGKEPPQKDPLDKNKDWAADEEVLKERLVWIDAEISKALAKLEPDQKEKATLRIQKRQDIREEEIHSLDSRLILTTFLKAFASSLDSHTAYFTPAEAARFMVQVQQRLFGIGVQLRDDLNGFTALKILEGSPATHSDLKEEDLVIAINGEPTIGMDLADGVELIRGEEGTIVTLDVLRKSENGKEEELSIDITRGEIVLKETRLETELVPFGDGVIAILSLHGFYQNNNSSSASDLYAEIQKISASNKLSGIVLNLRDNAGGVLPQAVAVTGLFITRGIVVAIKEGNGLIEYLREIRGKAAYDGPLIVLVNKASASAAEIVAGTLQDYGRAIVVGDEHTFGKGSFQTFTLDTKDCRVNPKGELKVTRGLYYTVSGKSPQLVGVRPDVVVPGIFGKTEIGERYGDYPLPSDAIAENFKDDLSDLPAKKRIDANTFYRFNLQMRLKTFTQFLPTLKKNSEMRMHSPFYEKFASDVNEEKLEGDSFLFYMQADPQKEEAVNILRDLICLLNSSKVN